MNTEIWFPDRRSEGIAKIIFTGQIIQQDKSLLFQIDIHKLLKCSFVNYSASDDGIHSQLMKFLVTVSLSTREGCFKFFVIMFVSTSGCRSSLSQCLYPLVVVKKSLHSYTNFSSISSVYKQEQYYIIVKISVEKIIFKNVLNIATVNPLIGKVL